MTWETSHHSKAPRSSTSVMFVVSRNGLMLLCYVVYKAKCVYPEWLRESPLGAGYNSTKMDGMTQTLLRSGFYT